MLSERLGTKQENADASEESEFLPEETPLLQRIIGLGYVMLFMLRPAKNDQPSVLVLKVCKRKYALAAAKRINRIFKILGDNTRCAAVPEVFLNPDSRSPLQLFRVPADKLFVLAESPEWDPPIRLTVAEQTICEKEGAVMVLGRSGTGKTCCIAMKMWKDVEESAFRRQPRRLCFVARSQALCIAVMNQVETLHHV